nr:hypothetical protein Iba_chr07fCG7340 [Ipomoea batatas]
MSSKDLIEPTRISSMECEYNGREFMKEQIRRARFYFNLVEEGCFSPLTRLSPAQTRKHYLCSQGATVSARLPSSSGPPEHLRSPLSASIGAGGVTSCVNETTLHEPLMSSWSGDVNGLCNQTAKAFHRMDATYSSPRYRRPDREEYCKASRVDRCTCIPADS